MKTMMIEWDGYLLAPDTICFISPLQKTEGMERWEFSIGMIGGNTLKIWNGNENMISLSRDLLRSHFKIKA